MEILLGILLVVNIVIFILYIFSAENLVKIADKTTKDLDKLVSIVNLNAKSQSEGFDMLAKNLLDVEFMKRVLEVHSEALQVRSAMGILDETNWPTYKIKK